MATLADYDEVEMKIIGRKRELGILRSCLGTQKPEFVVVYGRRRIGKTFLVKEFFNNRFSFYATGVFGLAMKEQLRIFNEELIEQGHIGKRAPSDWFEAFSMLKALLSSENVMRDPVSGKRIVFLDELPWMDGPKSNFKSALDFFWNSWGSTQKDLVLIVCGSATSWIIGNILGSKGGFYNRTTRQIHLNPFSLAECEELYRSNGTELTRQQMIESYMVFGGVPYYLDLFDRRLSLAQNIEELCFKEYGQLHNEFEYLFRSLFKKPDNHMCVIKALSKTRKGLTRSELVEETGIGTGERLSKVLLELEQCDFLRGYRQYEKKNGTLYQITDPFTLFCMKFIKDRKISSWLSFLGSPGYYAWSGVSFETVCLLHVNQIKHFLGIPGVDSVEYSWRSRESSPGAQIDLVIDRKDNVVNICEIKYSQEEYVIDGQYMENLKNKMAAFRKETGCRKAVHLTMVTLNGLKQNQFSWDVVNQITGEDLFAQVSK